MGRRAREKKMARVQAAQAEKAVIEVRKNQRLAPQLRYLKRVGLALAVTAFLLWIGSVVADKISLLVEKG